MLGDFVHRTKRLCDGSHSCRGILKALITCVGTRVLQAYKYEPQSRLQGFQYKKWPPIISSHVHCKEAIEVKLQQEVNSLDPALNGHSQPTGAVEQWHLDSVVIF